MNEVWNHAVEHYLARHLLSRDLCAWSDDGSLAASTNFSVFYTNAEGKSALLAVGSKCTSPSMLAVSALKV